MTYNSLVPRPVRKTGEIVYCLRMRLISRRSGTVCRDVYVNHPAICA